jgi:hypothetical protein
MTTLAYRPDFVAIKKDRQNKSEIVISPQTSTWTVKLQCSVGAHKQRLYKALTTPYCLESWLCLPCCNSSRGNIAVGLPGGFSVEHRCRSSERRVTISGRYAISRSGRLVFSMELMGASIFTGNHVEMRLSGDFERTRLRLRHGGFLSEEQCQWHHRLWSASLERLCALFNPPPWGAQNTINGTKSHSEIRSID